MRVVIDTNVFISSFLASGNPGEIIKLWKSGGIILCLSRPIYNEYLNIIDRLGFGEKKETVEITNLFAKNFNSVFTAKTPTLDIVKDDPSDNKFFECAVALKAKYIISGDKKVLEVENYFGIKVLKPKDFLDLF